ncbi:ammonia channel protein [Parafrigoribacterium humi]|uniref:ammonia channel protein n=1 Tax=Parafrigoribacterium humi TaxID=3144664 RepID=UPI0032F059C7
MSALLGVSSPDANALLLAFSSLLVLVLCLGIWVFYARTAPNAKRVAATAVVVIAFWVVCGYGFVVGPPLIRGFLGTPFAFLVPGFGANTAVVTQGPWFAVFECAVALLAVTILASALGERLRGASWLVFVVLWLALGYSPIAYSTFNLADGWVFTELQVNDQAGGLAVHIAAGAAVLAVFLVLRRGRDAAAPIARWRSLGGAAAVWIGAFGLTAGSEAALDSVVGTIALNVLIAPAAAAVAWWVIEFIITGKPSVRGVSSGVVAGVVAITPACNILTPAWTLALGVVAGAICAAAVTVSRRSSLGHGVGVVGIHLVGGVIGVIYIGIFGSGIGWKDTGQPDGIAKQAGAAVGIALWSFLVALVIVLLLRALYAARSQGFEAEEATVRNR